MQLSGPLLAVFGEYYLFYIFRIYRTNDFHFNKMKRFFLLFHHDEIETSEAEEVEISRFLKLEWGTPTNLEFPNKVKLIKDRIWLVVQNLKSVVYYKQYTLKQATKS